jgi:hypothetical protein
MKKSLNTVAVAGTVTGLLALASASPAQNSVTPRVPNVTPPMYDVTPPRVNVSPIPPPTFRRRQAPSIAPGLTVRPGRRPIYVPVPAYYYYWPYPGGYYWNPGGYYWAYPPDTVYDYGW